MDKNEIWDYLLEREIATESELILVTNINGYNVETLESVIYAKTGYRSVEQIEDAEFDC